MTSPARRHFMRVMAGQAAAPEAPPEARSVRARVEGQMALHLQSLKSLQSMEKRAEVKREILPEYADYVTGVLEADAGGPDPVLMTVMVWYRDVGMFVAALVIAQYGLRHDLALPERFARDLPTWLVEELAEAALDDPTALDPLARAMDLTATADMPDEVRAKGYKALGMARRDSDPAQALALLDRALALNKGAGVKTEIARLNKRAKDGDAATGSSEPGG